MAFLLAQADNLTHDMIIPGVAEQTVEEDPLLNYIPWVSSNGYKQVAWNRENSLGSESQWIEVNDEIQESAPTYSQQTTTLSILADRVEIDEFLVETKDAVQNVLQAVIASKAKQMMRKFHDTFYYGTAKGASSSAFAGLHNQVSTASPDMVRNAGSGATGGAGSLATLNATITDIKPGKPDHLLVNRTILRRLSAPYISNVQYNIGPQNFGVFLEAYSGIPLVVTDYLTQTETIASGTYSAKTGGSTTSMFAVKWGRDARTIPGTAQVFNNNGILGIQAGDMKIADPHPLEKKLGFSIKLKWYCTVILGSTLSLARYDGLTDAAWTA